MKKKLVSLFLVVALVAIAAVGTLAYFTDTKTATNTFTVGDVEITLTEPNWDTDGSKDAPDVYPGEALKKDPTVSNTGTNPCFVRIKITGLDSLSPAGLITYETNYVTGALGEGWVLHTDGCFYYTEPLCAAGTESESWNANLDDVTTALFDQIRIPTEVTNGFDGSYNVVVTAEAVQAQGAQPSWSAVKAMTVEEIAAWFTTCMN